jgi:hypothetical protein
MIDFKTPDHFLAVLQWAVANNCAKQLTERLDYLANYGDGNNVVELYADFAPQSFEFLMKKPDGSRWFNGGLIYSGPGQPLDGSSPALTVSLEKTGHEHKWSVHT